MLAWIARPIVRRAYRDLNRGRPEFLLRLFARDARLVFPGRNSWATVSHGREEIEAWMRRLVALGLRFRPHDVLVQGPPWNTRMCVRFTDELRDLDGSPIYRNEGVQYVRMAWGRIKEDRVYLDTQAVERLDEKLAGRAA